MNGSHLLDLTCKRHSRPPEAGAVARAQNRSPPRCHLGRRSTRCNCSGTPVVRVRSASAVGRRGLPASSPNRLTHSSVSGWVRRREGCGSRRPGRKRRSRAEAKPSGSPVISAAARSASNPRVRERASWRRRFRKGARSRTRMGNQGTRLSPEALSTAGEGREGGAHQGATGRCPRAGSW